MEEVKSANSRIILFIDHFHDITSSVNLLKPLLSSEDFCCIRTLQDSDIDIGAETDPISFI